MILNNGAPPHSVTLPLIIQVGFSGSRSLFNRRKFPEIDSAIFEKELESQLAAILTQIATDLNISNRYRLCTISQIAVGADMVFTRACQSIGITQRIFLPQHRDQYLIAHGSKGPDFSTEQRLSADTLLNSPHIIQERIVSDAPSRHERFHDANLEIARVSDIIICLIRTSNEPKPGGASAMIDLAKRRKRPILILTLDVENNSPKLSSHWEGRKHFKIPTLPIPFDRASLPASHDDIHLPTITNYCSSLKRLASEHANTRRRHFKGAAMLIIISHVIATFLALLALVLHNSTITFLLSAEVMLLIAGFSIHQYIHSSRSLEHWALCRLVAEVARSVTAIGDFHIYLEHLFNLPFPQTLRPLLRTISVIHLMSTRAHLDNQWKSQRDAYIVSRLTSQAHNAQIPYNQRVNRIAKNLLLVTRSTFIAASLLAIVSTIVKLGLIVTTSDNHSASSEGNALILLGCLAVMLPVLAVAAISLAGAFDLEARSHTSEELIEFLQGQVILLDEAESAREYARFLLETESRLLGETVNWYARRAFVGIA